MISKKVLLGRLESSKEFVSENKDTSDVTEDINIEELLKLQRTELAQAKDYKRFGSNGLLSTTEMSAIGLTSFSAELDNPFDERLSGKEDRYWANDMIENGYRIKYDPSLVCKHYYTGDGATWKGVG